jgi:hypothetical protein
MQKTKFRVWTFQTRFRPEDSQLIAQSLNLRLAIVVWSSKKSEWMRKNFRPKTSDLSHIQFLCGTSPCLGLGLRLGLIKKTENKYILRNQYEYFPFMRLSEPVYTLLREVQSFLGPKFFCPWKLSVVCKTSDVWKVRSPNFFSA